ncbi:hypothetical protein JCM33774_40380 [Actinophytocola sp. KF-1]
MVLRPCGATACRASFKRGRTSVDNPFARARRRRYPPVAWFEGPEAITQLAAVQTMPRPFETEPRDHVRASSAVSVLGSKGVQPPWRDDLPNPVQAGPSLWTTRAHEPGVVGGRR